MMLKIIRNSDAVAGALLAALGLFIIGEALKWEIVGVDGPGPGFFPLGYGSVILVLSLALAANSLLRATEPMREASGTGDRAGLWAALLTWLAFTGAVALMPALGFVISFALLTFVLVWRIFHQSPRKAALTALGCALGFYLVFPLALGVGLPVGWLGF
jgi:putative tricarboxylic transport membrane protein